MGSWIYVGFQVSTFDIPTWILAFEEVGSMHTLAWGFLLDVILTDGNAMQPMGP